MITKSVSVKERKDAERPIPMLVQIASRFKSSIHFTKDEKTVNAKSIMGMLSFGFASGQVMDVLVEGEDEDQAMNSIVDYITGVKKKS